jgi:site-specific recombinase XerD
MSLTLVALLDRYLAANECSQRYVESLRRTIRKAESNGLLNVCQLEPEAVNKFLVGGLPGLSQTTRHNIRRELMTLWKFAYETDMTDVYPARIRKIRAAFAPPQCWTMKEMRRLFKSASTDEKRISSRVQLRRCDVLPAWVGISYDSGLRFGDVHQLKAENFRNDCVCVVANKTGKPLIRKLSPATRRAVEKLLKLSPNKTLFSWCLPRRRALNMWKIFLADHNFVGSSKWLRRTAATQTELQEKGAATYFLQHSQPHLATRHYLDASQLTVMVGPPPIRSR